MPRFAAFHAIPIAPSSASITWGSTSRQTD
jgi:hypothetical protein